jgi:hypothetical protein
VLPRLLRLGVTVIVSAALVSGCQLAAPKKGAYENDPLVLSKKPVEGSSEPGPAVQLAGIEPMPPSVPTRAFPVAPSQAVVAMPVSTQKIPLIATPAVRTTTNGAVVRSADVLRYAPDLSWLQGVLEKQPDGRFELRYAEATLEDRWGGKVRLEDDPRWSEFHDGDVVRVEGAAAPINPENGWSVWNQPRPYRARTIVLVQRTS